MSGAKRSNGGRVPRTHRASTRRRADAELSLRARSLGLLYVSGATIGLISLLLPHPAKADTPGLYSNVGLAYLGGLVLLGLTRHIRNWMVHASLIAGVVLITRAVLLSGESVSFYSVWFIWVALYAFYFFDRGVAAAYVALSAGLYALTLVNDPPTTPIARWLTTVATLIVAGGFIDTLVRRARREATSAAANAQKMAQLADVAVQLASISDPMAARTAVCDAAAELTDATKVVLWEPTEERTELRMTAGTELGISVSTIPLGNAAAGAVNAFRSSRVVSARTVATTSDLAPEFSYTSGGPVACLWQPVIHNGQVMAVLGLLWRTPTAVNDPSLLTVCELISAEIKVTLERVALLARLESIARTDELTGLPNRRAWQEALPRELHRAERSSESLCVAMLDLDHFKRYNDARGHQAGDRLLKEVAVAWSHELRASDILARYGGEEFAVALPACALERARSVVERLRAVIPAEESCSAGIAVWDGIESASELVGRADQALYEAKRAGRDRTIVAGLESART
jgi:diguanylate cyclase (GGDEF)-like protein